jgi:hypothetical protein
MLNRVLIDTKFFLIIFFFFNLIQFQLRVGRVLDWLEARFQNYIVYSYLSNTSLSPVNDVNVDHSLFLRHWGGPFRVFLVHESDISLVTFSKLIYVLTFKKKPHRPSKLTPQSCNWMDIFRQLAHKGMKRGFFYYYFSPQKFFFHRLNNCFLFGDQG